MNPFIGVYIYIYYTCVHVYKCMHIIKSNIFPGNCPWCVPMSFIFHPKNHWYRLPSTLAPRLRTHRFVASHRSQPSCQTAAAKWGQGGGVNLEMFDTPRGGQEYPMEFVTINGDTHGDVSKKFGRESRGIFREIHLWDLPDVPDSRALGKPKKKTKAPREVCLKYPEVMIFTILYPRVMKHGWENPPFSKLLIDCWWVLLILDGRWSLMIIDDYSWWLMIAHDYWWLSMIVADSWWVSTIIDDYWLPLMIIEMIIDDHDHDHE